MVLDLLFIIFEMRKRIIGLILLPPLSIIWLERVLIKETSVDVAFFRKVLRSVIS